MTAPSIDAVSGLDHERIWLEPLTPDGRYGHDGRAWCQDKVWPTGGDGAEPTEYVRADLYEAQAHELAEARNSVSVLEILTTTPLFSHRALTAKLCEIMATRFGVRFLDPPDGGDVPVHDQVERMADALATAEARVAALEPDAREKDEALRPFVAEFEARREAYIRRYRRNPDVGAANFDAMPDDWKMEKSTFPMGAYRRARTALGEPNA